MTKARGSGAGARLQQTDGPGVLLEAIAGRAGAPTHLRAPLALGVGQLDLLEHDVDQEVEELVLAGHVVVDRHRLGTELVGQRADGQARQTPLVGDPQRGIAHALLAQPRSCRAVGSFGLHHLTSSVPSIFVRCTVASYTVRKCTTCRTGTRKPAVTSPSPSEHTHRTRFPAAPR